MLVDAMLEKPVQKPPAQPIAFADRASIKSRSNGLPKWRRQRLDRYLAANMDKRVNLEDMAAAAGLSKMHFAAQFRAATGFRPREYLLSLRIKRAKAILTSGEMSLVEVAFSTGFNAQAHFSTVFKRFTGTSPARWRQQRQRQRLAA